MAENLYSLPYLTTDIKQSNQDNDITAKTEQSVSPEETEINLDSCPKSKHVSDISSLDVPDTNETNSQSLVPGTDPSLPAELCNEELPECTIEQRTETNFVETEKQSIDSKIPENIPKQSIDSHHNSSEDSCNQYNIEDSSQECNHNVDLVVDCLQDANSQDINPNQEEEKLNVQIGSKNVIIDEGSTSREEMVASISLVSQNKYTEDSLRAKYESLLSESENSKADFQKQIDSLNQNLIETKNCLSKSEKDAEAVKEKLIQENVAIREQLTNRLEQLMIQCQSSNKDKESMVMKYAIAENEVLKVKKQKEGFEKKVKELQRDKELLQSKLKGFTVDKSKIANALESKVQEVSSISREIERLKEEINAKDVKIKWGQTKLRTETDAHKETQSRFDKAIDKITKHEEELQSMKKQAEKIVQDSIENENTRANLLDNQVRELKAILITERQKKEDLTAYLKSTTSELDTLKSVYFTLENDSSTMREKVLKYEQEREESEKLFESLQAEVINARQGAADLSNKLTSTSAAAELLEKEQAKVEALENEVKTLTMNIEDDSAELLQCRLKEAELLSFTQKLTDQNVKLQSQVTSLEGKIRLLEVEKVESKMELEESQGQQNTLKELLNSLKKSKVDEVENLTKNLNAKTKEVEELKTKVSDLYNEIKVQQKKHQNSTKDINREIIKLRKRLEFIENERPPLQNEDPLEEREDERLNCFSNEISSQSSHSESPFSSSTLPLSNHSRAPSNTSLNAIENPVINGRSHKIVSSLEEEGLSPDILVERIIRLQKSVMKKAEKVDFLEEHVSQLISELKKKNKIIHHYIMKEESGVMSDSKSDSTKAELIKKGGIMASVYGSTPKDGNMTLELSLEINKKLQAVLEDTLLKNITLKENLSTLGDEVANLSLQNSRLNLAKKT